VPSGTNPPSSKAPDRPDFHRGLGFTRRFARKGLEIADRLLRLGRLKVVQPGGYGQARSGWRGGSYPPLPGEALTPPEKLGPPLVKRLAELGFSVELKPAAAVS